MQNQQSGCSRWSWIVALIFALILLWMLLTGRGPSNACCSATTEPTSAEEVVPPTEAITEVFSFSATANDFSSTGDASKISWLAHSDALKEMLSGDLKVEGDDKNITLTGAVDSDASKQQKGIDLQTFFGSTVTVDNQLTLKAPEPVAATAPQAVKLYFDTGKASLPNDAGTTLAPIIDWLKINANSKAVLSGYHDVTGNQTANLLLAKNRAKSVKEALETAGIDEARIEMRKPETVDGGTDLAEARRVEVSVE